MDLDMKFTCPKCGNETLRPPAKPKSLAEMDGSVCESCGYTLTKDEILKQVVEFARKTF